MGLQPALTTWAPTKASTGRAEARAAAIATATSRTVRPARVRGIEAAKSRNDPSGSGSDAESSMRKSRGSPARGKDFSRVRSSRGG